MNNIKFTHELIKGKIAEIIFEQMIHSTKGYTILEFGYEKVVRQLAKERKTEEAKDTIEIIRQAPDFAVINEKSHEITLIEVKYMATVQDKWVLKVAKDIKKSWKKASLFVASPTGFYFDSVDTVIKNSGKITDFKHTAVPTKKMGEYLALLNEFISQDKH